MQRFVNGSESGRYRTAGRLGVRAGRMVGTRETMKDGQHLEGGGDMYETGETDQGVALR
jgi:hypothetical protein